MTQTQITYINRIALRAGEKVSNPALFEALASVFERSATELEGVSSDHRIVTTKVRQSLRKNTTRTATTNNMTWPFLSTGIYEINLSKKQVRSATGEDRKTSTK